MWSEEFIDRTYASYRNLNQALHWYGVHMPNVEDYELNGSGENPLFGAPEIRLFAVQGAGSSDDGQTVAIQHKIIFTKPICQSYEIRTIRFRITPWHIETITIVIPIPGDYYIDITGKPVKITHSWDNDIVGSAIKVMLTETDVIEVIVDGPANELSLSAQVGWKEITCEFLESHL